MRMFITLLTVAVLGAALMLSGSAAAGGKGKGPKCETKKGMVRLDDERANRDDDDGKVTFCHATSSAGNPFVVITTSVNACKAHEDHSKLPKGGERDIFPSGGCED